MSNHAILWRQFHNQRLDILKQIETIKEQVSYEDGERRDLLQAQIKRIAEALTFWRCSFSENKDVETTLVESIRFANRERHSNRLRVVELQTKLRVLKTNYYEVCRMCSALENKINAKA